MQVRASNGTMIDAETFGKHTDPPVVLIIGLNATRLFWPDEFIAKLVGEGFRVITFDNRDIGLSQRFPEGEWPNPLVQFPLARFGRLMPVPYTLHDMVEDTVGLMDTLGVDDAHIAGLSMGGMIGQMMSALHPERVRSFISLMSTPNNPKLKGPNLRSVRALLRKPKSMSVDDLTTHAVQTFSVIGSSREPEEAVRMRDHFRKSFERDNDMTGAPRQTSAILGTGDLSHFSKSIRVPTRVIHGTADPLVPIENGREIARLVPGADLVEIEGMAHDLPDRFLDPVVAAMAEHIRAVESGAELPKAAE